MTTKINISQITVPVANVTQSLVVEANSTVISTAPISDEIDSFLLAGM
jgi:hypothetical protein